MTRLKKWENMLKKEGFKIIYNNYSYWNNIPFAKNIETDEEFVLAYEGIQNHTSYIATIKDIVANEYNLNRLRFRDNQLNIKWKNNSISIL